jgi:branched-chain amino acid transport system ATP-binding protein
MVTKQQFEDGLGDEEALLQISGLRAAYGKKEILRGVSLSVARGELVAVIGPNGAGKSTLLKAVAGLLPAHSGSVRLGGYDIVGLPAHERSKLGIAYAMQNGRVFPNLTVEENLQLATAVFSDGTFERGLVRVSSLFPELNSRMGTRAGFLSGGLRQILAMALAVIREPVLLLLDEPSAGLAPRAANDAFQRIRQWNREAGSAVLFVEQNIRGAFSVAGRAVVMVEGTKALESNEPTALLNSGRLESLFLGNPTGQER